ncbi:MAG: nuclear transport factor 2 family protein [Deltaproteobacteria bacterium]|nr:nuclear transport factor 2 family protein [Deltaproteobacteria bacterium]
MMKLFVQFLSLVTSILLGIACFSPMAHTQTPTEDPNHAELRELRDSALKAMNSGDIDGFIKLVHPNIVFTGLDGRLSRGPEEVKAYFTRMITGPDRIVNSAQFDVTVDALTDLYGSDKTIGISHGTSKDSYNLTSGVKFELNTRWTATLIKENGKWMIGSFHSSADLFDNPLLEKSKGMLVWSTLGGAIAGLALGFLGAWMLIRNRANNNRAKGTV